MTEQQKTKIALITQQLAALKEQINTVRAETRTHIEKRMHLTEEEFNICTKFFIPKTIRKHQFLLNEGDICKNFCFVNSGCLREYTIYKKGIEHIIQFAIADWWISDLNSFLSGLPATYLAESFTGITS